MTDARTDSPDYIPWLIVVGLWAAINLAMTYSIAAPVYHGELLGPDGYMRLVRVGELWTSGDWYDIVIDRSNAPYGDTLHWTRPMDAIILVLALFILPFVSAEQALFAAAASSAPLIALLSGIVMVWTARTVMIRDRAFLAVFILLLQPAVIGYSMAGRADHHSLQFLAFLLCIGFTLRLLGPAAATSRIALMTGAAYGFALWVSIELMLLVALCQAALAANWIYRHGGFERVGLRAAAGFAAMTAVAIAVERPFAEWTAVEFDRISMVHLTIALVTLGFWAALEAVARYGGAKLDPTRRLLAAGAAAGLGAAVLAVLHPPLLAGPFAGVDPRILPIWHDRVAELQPLLPTDRGRLGAFLFVIGVAIPCLPFLAWLCWRTRGEANWPRWLFISALSFLYFLFALKHLRFGPFVEILSAIALAEMIGRVFDRGTATGTAFQEQLIRVSTAVTLIFGTAFAGMLIQSSNVPAAAGEAEPACRIEPIADVLNDPQGLGGTPLVIGGLLDHGPEIVYRTRHAVVGAPFHRNGDGIYDSYRLLAAADDSESRAIIRRRGIGLLMLCPTRGERGFFTQGTKDGTLYQRLLEDRVPDWLSPVPLAEERAHGFRLYRVRP